MSKGKHILSNKENMDELYMQRCLELAALGIGNTSPNPLVGAVIVHNGVIIGEGYHEKYGEAHAEVNAVNSVKDKSLLPQATMYVNLEPCSHHGKTPPCADLIVSNNIKHVVIGTVDPNSLVAGKGIKKLLTAGVEVKQDVLQKECFDLNKRFFTFFGKKRPYIILKWAQTKNGFLSKSEIDKREPFWISNDLSKTLVHKWRSEEPAILVGHNTVVADNPKLNTRNWPGKSPLRVILTSKLKEIKDSSVFDGSVPSIVFSRNNSTEVLDNVKIVKTGDNNIKEMLEYLYKEDIQSLIVEGGAKVLEHFISNNLWDECRVFTGAVNVKKGIKAPVLQQAPDKNVTLLQDTLSFYFNKPLLNS